MVGLPRFGQYLEKRRDMKVKDVIKEGLVLDKDPVKKERESSELGQILTIKDVIAKSVPQVGPWYKLDQKAQVVAFVNDDMCVNCGKCYMTCNDTGYQAITFDPKSHIPKVIESDCTGCDLCLSVCPIIGCIEMVPRKDEYKPRRGIAPGEFSEPIKIDV
jgi:dihydropyrimidine dehydrogenase (NADP+)